MKRFIPLFFGVAFSFNGFSQTVNDYVLDYNNADGVITDGGVFLNNESAGTPGLAIPSGLNLHTIYSMAFWYGGVDANGQLKLSAQLYENLKDQFKGPLTTDGSAEAPLPGDWTNALFPITRSEVSDHISNYMNPGYVVPPNILTWPAHGDINLSQDFYLAPFVDVDGNGIYEPLSGDYPCFRGDQAVYVIMNDKRDIHTSGGDPIGIEMHYMFYEYIDPTTDVDNTIFVHAKVINRGTQTLTDFKTSVFLDGDIGFSDDDYFGSDSTRNLMYFYNGDSFDDSPFGSAGYGQNPPAAGVMSLSHDFESIGAFLDFAPSNAAQYWNLMNGLDISGAPWTNTATSAPTKFLFPSDPGLVEPNSEVALATPPGDRRGVASIDLGVLTPFSEHHFDFAVIYNRDGNNNVENASGLLNVADVVKDFYDNSIVGDCVANNTVSLGETPRTEFSIYPNPSSGAFTISLSSDFSNAQAELLDLSGRVVIDQLELKSKETHIQISQPAGVYLLHLIVDGQKTTKRIILE